MIWTDVVQTVMMLVGIIVSIVFGMFHCLINQFSCLKSVQASEMLVVSRTLPERCLTEIDFNCRCTYNRHFVYIYITQTIELFPVF